MRVDDDLRRRLRFSTTSFGKLIEERNVFNWDEFSRKLSFYGVRPIALWMMTIRAGCPSSLSRRWFSFVRGRWRQTVIPWPWSVRERPALTD